MNDNDLLQLARDILPDVVGFQVDEFMTGLRPLTNIEMSALHALKEQELIERIEEHGCCCEEGPYEDTGRCRKRGGKCELLKQAERMIGRHSYGEAND